MSIYLGRLQGLVRLEVGRELPLYLPAGMEIKEYAKQVRNSVSYFASTRNRKYRCTTYRGGVTVRRTA